MMKMKLSINAKRFFVIIMVVLLFGVSFYRMNKHFDRLTRYPYNDPTARRLIDKYLSDDDIEYIIEYSIAPDNFLDYIEAKNFSIYHVPFYQELHSFRWYLSNTEVVDTIETLYKYTDDIEGAIEELRYHTLDEVIEKLKGE